MHPAAMNAGRAAGWLLRAWQPRLRRLTNAARAATHQESEAAAPPRAPVLGQAHAPQPRHWLKQLAQLRLSSVVGQALR
jgi:hypothetical protein